MDVYDRGSIASGMDLKKLCFDSPLEDLVGTEVQQPALVATSLAVLAALRARGIQADYVVGHSVGEFSALAAAEAMTDEEAIRLVTERGLAMAEAARQHPGSMAAILGLDDEIVETLCRKILGVWPANYNCPGQIVVSGALEAVQECIEQASLAGAKRAIQLKVSGAFHSPLVARAAERLKPAVRLGTLLVDQLTAPVRFTHATRALIGSGVRTFVEVGPGNVLTGLVRRIDRSVNTFSVNDLASLEKLESDLAST
jgi:[acyl-carrier-protein] S-malonyltransferase